MWIALFAACDTAPSDAEVAAATLTDSAHGEVRLYADRGAGYATAGGAPIRALTSLDAYAEGDTVFMAGLSHGLTPSFWAEKFPTLFVTVLESPDLRRWSAHAWRVDAPGSSLIDPALVQGPAGRELWFVQVDSHGDPAEGNLPSTVVRTRWDGTRFTDAEAVFTGPGLVDPSPVFAGERWEVFLTHDHHEVVSIVEGDTATKLVRAGITVPHARREGGRVTLTAQWGGNGPATAVVLTRDDGQAWSEPRPVLPAGSHPCSSPSTVQRGRETLLFCAEERPRDDVAPAPPRPR